MKSEHRHELQTNDLSKLTRKGVEFVEEHALKITAVICVLAVGIAAYRVLSSQAASRQQTAWYEYTMANSPDGYAEVAKMEAIKGTEAADWALLMSAEGRLPTGIQMMFIDRTNGLLELEQARDDFNTLKDHKDATIRERALFGLAVAEESLGNLDAAKAAYGKLAAENYKDSVFHKRAQERTEYLAQAGPQAFYGWFMKQDPQPPTPPKPDDTGSAGGGLSPLGGGDLPFGAGLPALDPGATPSGDEGESSTEPTESESDTTEPADQPASEPNADSADGGEPEASEAEPADSESTEPEPAETESTEPQAETESAAESTDDAK